MLKLIIKDKNITVTTQAINTQQLLRRAKNVLAQVGGWVEPIQATIYVNEKHADTTWGDTVAQVLDDTRVTLNTMDRIAADIARNK